jgi:hypothetical protein
MNEIEKESFNKKGLKTKQIVIKKNNDQIWHKIKWKKIVRNAIEKIIQLREWYKIFRDTNRKLIQLIEWLKTKK